MPTNAVVSSSSLWASFPAFLHVMIVLYVRSMTMSARATSPATDAVIDNGSMAWWRRSSGSTNSREKP